MSNAALSSSDFFRDQHHLGLDDAGIADHAAAWLDDRLGDCGCRNACARRANMTLGQRTSTGNLIWRSRHVCCPPGVSRYRVPEDRRRGLDAPVPHARVGLLRTDAGTTGPWADKGRDEWLECSITRLRGVPKRSPYLRAHAANITRPRRRHRMRQNTFCAGAARAIFSTSASHQPAKSRMSELVGAGDVYFFILIRIG